MSLRLRLIALFALVLLLSVVGGSMLVGWHAARSVQTELRAALDVGAKTVRNGFDDLAGTEDRKALRRLVATFNGNRHVRAILLDRQGAVVAASRLPAPAEPVPGWFLRLIGRAPPPILLPVPQTIDDLGAVSLEADPTNEVGEVWAESRDAVLVLTGFAALSALLILLVVGRTLGSLERVAAAFEHVGKDEQPGLLPAEGPPELVRLANGFNRMTQRLAAAAAQNERLNERLMTLQAEERADLARDLHDEIGPLLFAVDMTAATVERLAGSGRSADIPAHARSIHEAVGRMQRHVRATLERLRPLESIGLATAIERLVAFWEKRRPDITFAVTTRIEEERISEDMRDTTYRLIQEGMSNAIRHGKPTRIELAIAHDATGNLRIALTDDGIGMTGAPSSPRGPGRFGLIGMRERVMALAGSLSLRSGDNGKGLTLLASLPCARAEEEDAPP
jgi:two-component system sensor histidine kinase UhpB